MSPSAIIIKAGWMRLSSEKSTSQKNTLSLQGVVVGAGTESLGRAKDLALVVQESGAVGQGVVADGPEASASVEFEPVFELTAGVLKVTVTVFVGHPVLSRFVDALHRTDVLDHLALEIAGRYDLLSVQVDAVVRIVVVEAVSAGIGQGPSVGTAGFQAHPVRVRGVQPREIVAGHLRPIHGALVSRLQHPGALVVVKVRVDLDGQKVFVFAVASVRRVGARTEARGRGGFEACGWAGARGVGRGGLAPGRALGRTAARNRGRNENRAGGIGGGDEDHRLLGPIVVEDVLQDELLVDDDGKQVVSGVDAVSAGIRYRPSVLGIGFQAEEVHVNGVLCRHGIALGFHPDHVFVFLLENPLVFGFEPGGTNGDEELRFIVRAAAGRAGARAFGGADGFGGVIGGSEGRASGRVRYDNGGVALGVGGGPESDRNLVERRAVVVNQLLVPVDDELENAAVVEAVSVGIRYGPTVHGVGFEAQRFLDEAVTAIDGIARHHDPLRRIPAHELLEIPLVFPECEVGFDADLELRLTGLANGIEAVGDEFFGLANNNGILPDNQASRCGQQRQAQDQAFCG
mmetsp:Transcript_19477/g.45365  ORF Transcript_19477/g.45365 Transcript_19477/m.45365 type:complete len:573 (-) Transcript_19477:188-1906(-)